MNLVERASHVISRALSYYGADSSDSSDIARALYDEGFLNDASLRYDRIDVVARVMNVIHHPERAHDVVDTLYDEGVLT